MKKILGHCGPLEMIPPLGNNMNTCLELLISSVFIKKKLKTKYKESEKKNCYS